MIVTKVAELPEESVWHLVEGEVVAVNGQPAPNPVKPEALEDKRGKRGGKKGKGKGAGEEAFESLPSDIPPAFMGDAGAGPAESTPNPPKPDLPPRLSRGPQSDPKPADEPVSASIADESDEAVDQADEADDEAPF